MALGGGCGVHLVFDSRSRLVLLKVAVYHCSTSGAAPAFVQEKDPLQICQWMLTTYNFVSQ